MSQTSRFPRRTFLKASAALTAGALFNPLVQAANERRTVIFDCDPGQDDAIAILFAFGARDRLDVRALVAVAGNVPLNLTERNARIIRDWAGQTKTLPVYAGCPRPLMRPLITAANVHGKTGLEGVELHEPLAPLAAQHGVAYLIETLKAAAPHSVTICATGPLTNLATALTEAPEIREGLREIVIGKLAKRGVDLRNIEQVEPDISPLGHARQELKIQQGLEGEKAKEIIKAIKEAGFKVQSQLQDRQIRVTGKKKDELQSVIQFVRGKDFKVATNFKNFRD